jgi:hypothetical protein
MNNKTENFVYALMTAVLLAPIFVFWWTVGADIVASITKPQQQVVEEQYDPEYPNKRLRERGYRELGDAPPPPPRKK